MICYQPAYLIAFCLDGHDVVKVDEVVFVGRRVSCYLLLPHTECLKLDYFFDKELMEEAWVLLENSYRRYPADLVD